jgi:hypothetical protein
MLDETAEPVGKCKSFSGGVVCLWQQPGKGGRPSMQKWDIHTRGRSKAYAESVYLAYGTK